MKEVRVGLVLYGGVSLAVYMNGVVTELWHALSASRAAGGRDGEAEPSLLGGVYRDLFAELVHNPRTDELRLVVDVVAGTSAGGVNGVVLGKSVMEGADARILNTVWIEDADIGKLREEAPRRAPRWLRLIDAGSRIHRSVRAVRNQVDALPGLSWTWLRDQAWSLISAEDGRTIPLSGSYFARMIARTLSSPSSSASRPVVICQRSTATST